jgi:photosystem II stability/assembly factor-like uncharacterized protein
MPYPTQMPPPYGFPKQWQVAQGAPQVSAWQLGSGFAFAPSAPQVGYICAVAMGAVSGPAFYATRDGGRSWSPASATPFESSGQCGIFVDPLDPNDILLAQDKLWRSQDGGATWHQLAAITVPGWSISVLNLAIVGPRLIAAVAINGEGTLDNNLYASDDGGATWHQLGASLPARVSGFVAMGATIIVESDPPYVGSVAPPLSVARQGASPAGALAAPLSSSGPPPIFNRSTDAGQSWTTLSIPGGLPTITPAAGSSAYFGITISTPTTTAPSMASWSRDGGVTWAALPSLTGVEGGYPTLSGQFDERLMAPDGTALVNTVHVVGQSGTYSEGGIFCLRPGAVGATWQPLAPSGPANWQAVPTATGVRVWALQTTSASQPGGTLVYIDLP